MLSDAERLPQSESRLEGRGDACVGSSSRPLASVSLPKVSRALLLGRLWLVLWGRLAAGLRSPPWSATGFSSETWILAHMDTGRAFRRGTGTAGPSWLPAATLAGLGVGRLLSPEGGLGPFTVSGGWLGGSGVTEDSLRSLSASRLTGLTSEESGVWFPRG